MYVTAYIVKRKKKQRVVKRKKKVKKICSFNDWHSKESPGVCLHCSEAVTTACLSAALTQLGQVRRATKLQERAKLPCLKEQMNNYVPGFYQMYPMRLNVYVTDLE